MRYWITRSTTRFICFTIAFIFLSLVEILIPCSANEQKTLYPIIKNGKWGFIDRTGQVVIEPAFDDAWPFENDLAVIRKGDEKTGKYGLIDLNGKIIFQPLSEKSPYFSDDVAWIRINNKWGLIDKKGSIIIQPEFEFEGVSVFKEGLSPVLVKTDGGNKWGYLNKKGQFVVEPILEQAAYFTDGLAKVKFDGKYGYIDTSGKYAIEPQFALAGMFYENLANVALQPTGDQKYGFIDKSGKFVIEPRFSYADNFVNGIACVLIGEGKDWKAGYIDKTGKMIVPPKYEWWARFNGEYANAGYFRFENPFLEITYQVLFKDQLKKRYCKFLCYERKLKFTFIDKNGKELFPLMYGNTGSQG